MTWKEKRQELAKLQKTRKFTVAKEAKKSFRIEVEEVKRKTKCHKCGRVGHWSRECKSKTDIRSGKSSSSPTPPAATGAGLVMQSAHEFVACVDAPLTLVQRAMQMVCPTIPEKSMRPESTAEVLLVSSPGHGVIDSGCGRAIIGADTLQMSRTMWRQKGVEIPALQGEVNHFKYGNGEVETIDKVVQIPVHLAGHKGVISAAVIKGCAPLDQLGRSADYLGKRTIQLFEDQREMPLERNVYIAGQFVICDSASHRG